MTQLSQFHPDSMGGGGGEEGGRRGGGEERRGRGGEGVGGECEIFWGGIFSFMRLIFHLFFVLFCFVLFVSLCH